MSIERNLLKHAARMLGALACAVALAACVSPDLEPPGAAGTTTLPGNPRAAERGAEDRTAKAMVPAAGAGPATTTAAGATPPTVTPGGNMAAAGQGAKPAMGMMMTAPRQSTTPPAAAGSGAPDVPGDPNGDADADAGTQTP